MRIAHLAPPALLPLLLAVPAAAPPPSTAAPQDVLDALEVERATLQELELPVDPAGDPRIRLELDGVEHELVLRPRRIVADGFRAMVGDPAGGYVPVEVAPPRTFRGRVAGRPGSTVAAALVGGGLRASIRLDASSGWWRVQPLSEVDPAADPAAHAVYRSADLLPSAGACVVARAPGEARTPRAKVPVGAELKSCEVAVDADHELLLHHGGSVDAVVADVTSVLNDAELIYASETGIVYELTAVFVQTAEPDPYDETDSTLLLQQFAAHWNGQHADVPRDVAQLFTAKELDGPVIGSAFLNTICDVSGSYGLVQTTSTASFAKRVALTAHELGHNWGAVHCDGQPDCAIMCSSLAGCAGGFTTFGAVPEAAIEFIKSVSPCLEDGDPPPPPPPPVLTSIEPSSVQAFGAASVTLTGEHLSTTQEVLIGASTLTPSAGATIVDDSTILLTPPAPEALGPAPVSVVTAGGTSAPLDLDFTATDPPALAGDVLVLSGQDVAWSFGAAPHGDWFLGVSLAPTTVPFGAWSVLADGLLLDAGTLDAVGLGSATVLAPPGLAGTTIWTQVVVLDLGSATFVGSTNLVESLFLL